MHNFQTIVDNFKLFNSVQMIPFNLNFLKKVSDNADQAVKESLEPNTYDVSTSFILLYFHNEFNRIFLSNKNITPLNTDFNYH